MDYVICDLCSADNTLPVYTLSDTNYHRPGQFTLVQCRQCHLVYLNPRPDREEIRQFYPDMAYDSYASAVADGSGWARQIAPHQQRVHWLTQIVGRPGHVLDVGCGTGFFLFAMRQAGWITTGVEPNPYASHFARERLQLDVHTADLIEAALPAETFDLVTLWDSLEHTPSPTAVLRETKRLLKPGGYLAISLPNWDSLERRLFGRDWIALDAPRHFYHFSPAVLRRAVEMAGFAVHQIKASAPPLSLASNVMRWAGNRVFGTARWETAGHTESLSTGQPRTLTGLKAWAAALIYVGVTPINLLLNGLNRGATLTLLAQKGT